MTDAYVHIIIDPGAVTHAANEISEIDAVSGVHTVTGEYDVIAQLELDRLDDIPAVVAGEIHSISGVIETTTSVAFEP